MAAGDNFLVHICPRDDWQAAQAAGEYRAASLETVGFIHCSRPEQVLGVANSFYTGVPDLVLLWIDPARLSAKVRWELADGQLFPHLYGPLNLEAVVAVTGLFPDDDGIFRKTPVID